MLADLIDEDEHSRFRQEYQGKLCANFIFNLLQIRRFSIPQVFASSTDLSPMHRYP